MELGPFQICLIKTTLNCHETRVTCVSSGSSKQRLYFVWFVLSHLQSQLNLPPVEPLIEDCRRKLPRLNQLMTGSVCCAGTGEDSPPLCFASPNNIYSFKYFSAVQTDEARFYMIPLVKGTKLKHSSALVFLYIISTINWFRSNCAFS
jgi:hypothetical protein